MNDSTDIQVIGLGQACVDFLGRFDVYPREDEKVELVDLHMQCGGPASTALVALSRLGIRTSFLGALSDDFFGIEILRALREEGVDTADLNVIPGYTSQVAFIGISRETGARTIFWHRGSMPPLRSSDVDLRHFPGARILHLDGLMIEAGLEAARQARDLGLRVVMDAGTYREGSRDLVSLVDVLIASRGFAEPLVGGGASQEETLRTLQGLGPHVVVVTLGGEGSIGWDGKTLIRQDAFPVQALDTTGAGDVYHGAYIYGMLQGWDTAGCMRFASAVSAMKCRQIGARRGIPRLPEVRDFLARHD
ncbi:MAG: sugar kinase [Deltaproteobacteria bacterium]|nr:sugar kinase [Deltaproteobacteria bacterium]